ncbi:hypothetical protein Tco_0282513 [Tanacetum coccineum]
MANLQQALTSGTQTDKAPVYESDGSAKVQLSNNCYNNDIFNMFTQEKQYTELLEPIPESHQVQQNDSNVIYEVSSVEQGGGIVEQHPATVEETRAYFESLYNNLAIEVDANYLTRLLTITNPYGQYLNHKLHRKIGNWRLLRAVVSQDIMSIVQSNSVVDTSNLQTELDHTTACFENIKRLQAQLGDPKSKSKDTSYVSNTLDPLPQKLENENIELEFQVNLDNSTSNVLIPLDSWTSGLLVYKLPLSRVTSGLRPYHFTYPERRFGVQELLKVTNNTPTIDCEVKGVTTRGGKTTTQDAQNNDTSVHAEEPQAVNHDEPIESNEVLTNDQPQKTSKPVAQPSNKIQTPPIPSSKIKEGKRRGSAEEVLRKPEAAPHNFAFHRGPSPNAKVC